MAGDKKGAALSVSGPLGNPPTGGCAIGCNRALLDRELVFGTGHDGPVEAVWGIAGRETALQEKLVECKHGGEQGGREEGQGVGEMWWEGEAYFSFEIIPGTAWPDDFQELECHYLSVLSYTNYGKLCFHQRSPPVDRY